MRKLYSKPILLLCLAAIVLMALTLFTQQTHLIERAIALSLGIDKTPNGYLVSIQNFTAKNSGSTNGNTGTGYVILYGEGATMASAMEQIEKKAGSSLSVSHCNLVIVNKDMLAKDTFPAIDYLIKKWSLPEQSLLLISDTTALELQRAIPPDSTPSAFMLQKSLLTNKYNTQGYSINIKGFLANYFSLSRTAILPLVKTTKVNDDDVDSATSETGNIYRNFDFSHSIVMSDRPHHIELDTDETIAVNLVTAKKLNAGNCIIKYDNKTFAFDILSVSNSFSCANKNNNFFITAKVNIKLTIVEISPIDSINYKPDEKVIGTLQQLVSDKYRSSILSLYTRASNEGLDVYNLYNALYSHCGNAWLKKAPNDTDFYKDINFDASVKVQIAR